MRHFRCVEKKIDKEAYLRKSAFISVEIVIKTEANALVKWFEDQDNYVNKITWNPEKWYIYCDPIGGSDANTVISKLCQMIEGLPEDIRRDWDQAPEREFFVAYEIGDKPPRFTEHFTTDTTKSAMEVNAGIGFAFYPALPPDDEAKKSEVGASDTEKAS